MIPAQLSKLFTCIIEHAYHGRKHDTNWDGIAEWNIIKNGEELKKLACIENIEQIFSWNKQLQSYKYVTYKNHVLESYQEIDENEQMIECNHFILQCVRISASCIQHWPTICY